MEIQHKIDDFAIAERVFCDVLLEYFSYISKGVQKVPIGKIAIIISKSSNNEFRKLLEIARCWSCPFFFYEIL